MGPTLGLETCGVLGCAGLLGQHLGFSEVPPGAAAAFREALGDQAASLITLEPGEACVLLGLR